MKNKDLAQSPHWLKQQLSWERAENERIKSGVKRALKLLADDKSLEAVVELELAINMDDDE